MVSLRRSLSVLCLAVVSLCIPLASAQEPGSPHNPASAEGQTSEEHKGGLPEVSVFWKWANFAILFGVLAYLASKQAGPLLQKRRAEITEGMAAGERARAEAEQRARAVDARLANLDSEIARLRSQALEDRERERKRLEREAEAEMERVHRQAAMEIESAGKQSAIEVRRFAAHLALELAERKIRRQMSPATQRALVDRFVEKVAGANGGSRA